MSKLRVIIMGYVIRGPLGGYSWYPLQYIQGLRSLGHEVFFIEDSGDDNYCCYNPITHLNSTDCSYGISYADCFFSKIDLANNWAYYDGSSGEWTGPCSESIFNIIESSDLLLNIAGSNLLRDWMLSIPKRVFIDGDPAFTQIKINIDSNKKNNALNHTDFFTIGENINKGYCKIPNTEINWATTRQPASWNDIKYSLGQENSKYTTIMHWESKPGLTFNGVYYGSKADSFMEYMNLPKHVSSVLELAMGSHEQTLAILKDKGWNITDPIEITKDVETYLNYINNSKAEFSVAQHGYVISRSGWFSERSVAYISSGRPIVVMDTGFSDWLETGMGVKAYSNIDEAISGIEDINTNYYKNSIAAREIAHEYFDSNKVLSKLIDDIYIS